MTDQEATMPEPLVMTLTAVVDALARLQEMQEYHGFQPDNDLDDHIIQARRGINALGRPVVERDDKAELVEALDELLDSVGSRVAGSVQFCADCGTDWHSWKTQHIAGCKVAKAEAVLARVRGSL